jgi:hypothetical protein
MHITVLPRGVYYAARAAQSIVTVNLLIEYMRKDRLAWGGGFAFTLQVDDDNWLFVDDMFFDGMYERDCFGRRVSCIAGKIGGVDVEAFDMQSAFTLLGVVASLYQERCRTLTF